MNARRACTGFLSDGSGANSIACSECAHLKACKFESPTELAADVSIKDVFSINHTVKDEEEEDIVPVKRSRRSKVVRTPDIVKELATFLLTLSTKHFKKTKNDSRIETFQNDFCYFTKITERGELNSLQILLRVTQTGTKKTV